MISFVSLALPSKNDMTSAGSVKPWRLNGVLRRVGVVCRTVVGGLLDAADLTDRREAMEFVALFLLRLEGDMTEPVYTEPVYVNTDCEARDRSSSKYPA